jgi:hypothetical protein
MKEVTGQQVMTFNLSEKMKVMRKKSPTLYHSSASVLLVRKTQHHLEN